MLMFFWGGNAVLFWRWENESMKKIVDTNVKLQLQCWWLIMVGRSCWYFWGVKTGSQVPQYIQATWQQAIRSGQNCITNTDFPQFRKLREMGPRKFQGSPQVGEILESGQITWCKAYLAYSYLDMFVDSVPKRLFSDLKRQVTLLFPLWPVSVHQKDKSVDEIPDLILIL